MLVFLLLALAIFNTLYGYLFESRRREQLKSMFGQYVPATHIDEMLKHPGKNRLEGENREISVLFADIRNFTSISENMTASELKTMLNAFFTPMTEIIFKHQGTIDKYVGDMIMAFWGAPLADPKHTTHAIAAALDMQHTVKELEPLFKQHHWPKITIGIGLNSGLMSVGDMGSQFRRNYTVLGDAVNLGSRVEGLTKYYGAEIITTEYTQKNQPTFVFQFLDRVRVKGKNLSIAIYEPLCPQSELQTTLQDELALHQIAMQHYTEQHWKEAHTALQQLHTLNPNRKLYSLYLERIAYLIQHPPKTWDGIFTHTSK
jgi:adenylate cyclase